METSNGKKGNSRKQAALKNLEKLQQVKKKVDWVRLNKYKVNRIAGMNMFQAALKAGYAYNTARHCMNRYDRLVRVDIISALENAGATNQVMAQEIVNLATSATKRIPCTVEVNAEGEITIDDNAKQEVPDLHLRKESWELIAKLKKQLGTGAVIPTGNFKRLVIMVEQDTEEIGAADNRRENQIDIPAKSCVEVTD